MDQILHIEKGLADMKTYPVEGFLWAGKNQNIYTRCVVTGERRPPKKGEYYLSGAVPMGWKALADLSTVYHIVRLVKVEKITTERIVADL